MIIIYEVPTREWPLMSSFRRSAGSFAEQWLVIKLIMSLFYWKFARDSHDKV